MALYIWKRLERVPEEDRKKKEVRLWLNLKKAMEDLGESFVEVELRVSALKEKRRPRTPDTLSFGLAY